MVNSVIKLFADDTKLYRSINNESDRILLQKDLDAVMDWSTKWQLPFNTNKCKTMTVGAQASIMGKYTIDTEGNKTVLTIVKEKDLGVKFDECLNFATHISEVITKGNQRIGLIRRSFTFMNKQTFLTLYKALVRPLLEYCNTVWHPLYKKDSEGLEKVQRRATKLVKELEHLDYPSRLRTLDLPSLVYRRRRADMLQIYRIIRGIDKLDKDKFIELVGQTATRGHSFKIFKPRNKSRVKYNTLGSRAVSDWNSLSEEVVQADNINQFKNRLKALWKTKEYKYDPTNHYG